MYTDPMCQRCKKPFLRNIPYGLRRNRNSTSLCPKCLTKERNKPINFKVAKPSRTSRKRKFPAGLKQNSKPKTYEKAIKKKKNSQQHKHNMLTREERSLAKQLQEVCDEHGMEKDPPIAATIFHKLGKIYKEKRSNKFDLIRSAGLFNAALVRKPNDNEIEIDLLELCKIVLEDAQAQNKSVNLVKKAHLVKEKIDLLRERVREDLKKIKQIPDNVESEKLTCLEEEKIKHVKCIQERIAKNYTEIMTDMCKYCEDVMGNLPCRYAVAGMGSLARKEVTPYSDFEHVILLEDLENYEDHLEYFRWFSVIFHVVIINLQETIIPNLHIQSLNDTEYEDWFFDGITTNGVSFDGMMPHACKFPLGRPATSQKPWNLELIKPVKEMVRYLSSEENLKNGYYLSDILTKTSYVGGDDELYRCFENKVKQFRESKTQHEIDCEVKKQVNEDLSKFSTRTSLTSLDENRIINIKSLVYRSTTIFISALGRKHGLSECSCFEIVDKLADKKHITDYMKRKISFAVAVACEMRLRVYMEKKSQNDRFDFCSYIGNEREVFLDIVGKSSIVNYFQISYCLQCEIEKRLKIFSSSQYSNPILLNIFLCHAFQLNFLIRHLFKNYFETDLEIEEFDFERYLKDLEHQTKLSYGMPTRNRSSSLVNNTKMHENKNEEDFFAVGMELFDNGDFETALECFTKLCTKSSDAETLKMVGLCYMRLYMFDDALQYLRYCIQDYRLALKVEQKEEEKQHIAEIYCEIGYCLLQKRHYKSALSNFEKSYQHLLDLNTSCLEDSNNTHHIDTTVARTVRYIGLCHMHLKQISNIFDVSELFPKHLDLSFKRSNNPYHALMLSDIGEFFFKKNESLSLTFFYQGFLNLQCIDTHKFDYYFLFDEVFNIGRFLMKESKLELALKYFRYCLSLFDELKEDSSDEIIFESLLNIANSFKSEEILNQLEFFLVENKQFIPKDDLAAAEVLESIGKCFQLLGKFLPSLLFYFCSFRIYKNIYPENNEENKLSLLLIDIDECFKNLKNFKQAIHFYKKARDWWKNDDGIRTQVQERIRFYSNENNNK